MRPQLVINGIDFNDRCEKEKSRLKSLIGYKYQVQKWIESPSEYPIFDVKLLGDYRPYRSDMTVAFEFMLMAEKRQQKILVNTDLHMLLTKHNIGHVFDPRTGDLTWY